MRERVPILVGSPEVIEDELARNFINAVSDLAMNSQIDEGSTLRSGCYAVPQLGPIPFDTLRVAVVGNFFTTPAEFEEDYILELTSNPSSAGYPVNKLSITYGKELQVDERGESESDWPREQVTHVLNWLRKVERQPDDATEAAEQRLKKVRALLSNMVANVLGTYNAQHAWNEHPVVKIHVYDPVYRSVELTQGQDDLLALSLFGEIMPTGTANVARQDILTISGINRASKLHVQTSQAVHEMQAGGWQEIARVKMPADTDRMALLRRTAMARAMFLLDRSEDQDVIHPSG